MHKSNISAYKSLRFGIATVYNSRCFFLKCATVLVVLGVGIFLSTLLFTSLDKILLPNYYKPLDSMEYYAEVLGIDICASWIVSNFGRFVSAVFSFFAQIFFLVSICVLLSTGFGYIKICLDYVNDGSSHMNQMFSQVRRFFRIAIANIVFGVILAVGFFLLVVPAIFWYARFAYFRCIMIDKNVGVFTALSRSWALTEGVWVSTLWFAVISLVVEIFGLWIFFTPFPVINLAWAHMYRQLEREHAAANN